MPCYGLCLYLFPLELQTTAAALEDKKEASYSEVSNPTKNSLTFLQFPDCFLNNVGLDNEFKGFAFSKTFSLPLALKMTMRCHNKALKYLDL